MWGESWGELIWGTLASPVPLTGPVGFLAMAICFGLGGLVMQTRLRRYWAVALSISALLAVPAATLAFSFPHTFTNGTVADADEVNANFDAVGTELDALGMTISDYVSQNCLIYFGWRDSCNGCSSPPTKWGLTGPAACANGAGGGNTCTLANLGGETVRLFGLDLDGEVDGNDKLYIGFVCG